MILALTSMSKDLIMGKVTSLESQLFHALPFHGLLIDCELMSVPCTVQDFQYGKEVSVLLYDLFELQVIAILQRRDRAPSKLELKKCVDLLRK